MLQFVKAPTAKPSEPGSRRMVVHFSNRDLQWHFRRIDESSYFRRDSLTNRNRLSLPHYGPEGAKLSSH